MPWGRQELRGEPALIYRAGAITDITLWAVNEVSANRNGTTVFVSHREDLCSPYKGTPLPPASTISLKLYPGDAIYGMAEDIGLVGYIAVPQR